MCKGLKKEYADFVRLVLQGLLVCIFRILAYPKYILHIALTYVLTV